METVLEAEGLQKHYGAVHALKGVSLTVRNGEVLGVVGDNGAGKSTLLKILSGTLKPSEGAIRFRDHKIAEWSAAEVRQLGIETVYQDLALAPHLTVTENIFLGREVFRRDIWGRVGKFVDYTAMDEVAREVLHSVGITIPSLRVKVSALSGGQRQAVAIARAIHWGSSLLILDEPTAALGVEETENVFQLVASVKAKNIPTIVVSHDLPSVLKITDRIIVLRLGQLVASLTTAETHIEEVIGWITGARR